MRIQFQPGCLIRLGKNGKLYLTSEKGRKRPIPLGEEASMVIIQKQMGETND